jgi:pimeloyl-ACP methyl ester carboxylesterase
MDIFFVAAGPRYVRRRPGTTAVTAYPPALLLAASRASLGGCANLIGVCQGGWMALVYAARYPSKIRGLVLAGAPVDINAGESELRITGAGTCAN